MSFLQVLHSVSFINNLSVEFVVFKLSCTLNKCFIYACLNLILMHPIDYIHCELNIYYIFWILSSNIAKKGQKKRNCI